MYESQRDTFGRRASHHTIIIAKGDSVRHVTIRPWVAATAIGMAGLFTIGYLAATSYLLVRDDLIGAATARRAKIERGYEDRIAALRAEVDRVTSRQLLDQKDVEDQVRKLYERQKTLKSQHGRLGPLLERARTAGLLAGNIPVPSPRPRQTANAATQSALAAIDAATDAGSGKRATPSTNALVHAYAGETSAPLTRVDAIQTGSIPASEDVGDPDAVVGEIADSLHDIEYDQLEKLQNLTINAAKKATAIRSVIDNSGFPKIDGDANPDERREVEGVGGPYLRLDDPTNFDASLKTLSDALDRLEAARKQASTLPFGHPVASYVETSAFGARSDPFLGKRAFHPGIDFRAPLGTAVHATGAGTVVRAGRAGGYGNMVEIDHGNGVSTRYGHLSKILVSRGDTVHSGSLVGRSGSTGRSTGPHLHYEVRLDGRPVDPGRFLDAGLKLRPLMGS